MGQARQTFERRQLGLTLRRLRDKSGKPQQAAADVLGKVRTRVVQLEEGTATASEEDLIKLLDLYGVRGKERRTVLELGARTRKRQKRGPHYDTLPDSFRRLADLEASASEINSVDQGIIPGMLQSPEYMRALFAEADGVLWESGGAGVTDRLTFRQERQSQVFEAANLPIMRYVITEDALRANMGSPDVMQEQLNHLLTLMDEYPLLTVRVLTTATYGNPVRGGGFEVLDFGRRGAPIGTVTSPFSPTAYLDDEAEVAHMLRAFHRIWELAQSRDDSRRLIRSIVEDL